MERLPYFHAPGARPTASSISGASSVAPSVCLLSSSLALLFSPDDGVLHAWELGPSIHELVQTQSLLDVLGGSTVRSVHIWLTAASPIAVFAVAPRGKMLATEIVTVPLTRSLLGGASRIAVADHVGSITGFTSAPQLLVVSCTSAHLAFCAASYPLVAWRLACAAHPAAVPALCLTDDGLVLACAPSPSLVAALERSQLTRRRTVELTRGASEAAAPSPPPFTALDAARHAVVGMEMLQRTAGMALAHTLAPFTTSQPPPQLSAPLDPSQAPSEEKRASNGGHVLLLDVRWLCRRNEALPPGVCWRLCDAPVACLALGAAEGGARTLAAADVMGQCVQVWRVPDAAFSTKEEPAPVLRPSLWQASGSQQRQSPFLLARCERGLTTARATGLALTRGALFALTDRGTLHVWGIPEEPELAWRQPVLRMRARRLRGAPFPSPLLSSGVIGEPFDMLEVAEEVHDAPSSMEGGGIMGMVADAIQRGIRRGSVLEPPSFTLEVLQGRAGAVATAAVLCADGLLTVFTVGGVAPGAAVGDGSGSASRVSSTLTSTPSEPPLLHTSPQLLPDPAPPTDHHARVVLVRRSTLLDAVPSAPPAGSDWLSRTAAGAGALAGAALAATSHAAAFALRWAPHAAAAVVAAAVAATSDTSLAPFHAEDIGSYDLRRTTAWPALAFDAGGAPSSPQLSPGDGPPPSMFRTAIGDAEIAEPNEGRDV